MINCSNFNHEGYKGKDTDYLLMNIYEPLNRAPILGTKQLFFYFAVFLPNKKKEKLESLSMKIKKTLRIGRVPCHTSSTAIAG